MGCSEKPETTTTEINANPAGDSLTGNVVLTEIDGDTCFKPTDESELPPFKYDCLCDLHEFGEHMTSDGTLHVYKRGKGFNPHLRSCTFSFYEGVMNMHVGDTTFKVLKVHLLDVENFSVPTNNSVYGENNVNHKVIWIYERHQTYDTTIVDPFHTSIYHDGN